MLMSYKLPNTHSSTDMEPEQQEVAFAQANNDNEDKKLQAKGILFKGWSRELLAEVTKRKYGKFKAMGK